MVRVWCDLWGMKLNASKTNTMIVSRSRTVHPHSSSADIPNLCVSRKFFFKHRVH